MIGKLFQLIRGNKIDEAKALAKFNQTKAYALEKVKQEERRKRNRPEGHICIPLYDDDKRGGATISELRNSCNTRHKYVLVMLTHSDLRDPQQEVAWSAGAFPQFVAVGHKSSPFFPTDKTT